MSSSKKLLQAAAGSAGGAGGLNVEEVFSTYLYTADGTSSQTITNNIDLSAEGGLVLLSSRGSSAVWWYDTERGVTKELRSDSAGAESTESVGLTAFNTDGFTFGTRQNQSAYGDSVSWTFRKAPKFFDVVTYTGNGSSQVINHNLGTTIGSIIIKRTDSAFDWKVYHRSLGTSQELELNQTAAAASTGGTVTAVSSSSFTVGGGTGVNASGGTYVAYLFAHNDGDGDFGPDGDADIIKCGSYTGNSSNDGPEIDLGFEPQWIMIKRASNVSGWYIWDTMRGIVSDGAGDAFLYANASDSEDPSGEFLKVTSTGFKLQNAGLQTNGSSNDYIYIAIRRGPMAVPESATDVFDVNTYSNNGNSNIYNTGFNTDMNINKNATSSDGFYVIDRLRGAPFLLTNLTAAETGGTSTFWNTGNNLLDLESSWWSTTSGVVSWSWKRAPNFFDVVAYTGTGSARTVSHNLGVAPEMIWVKNRIDAVDWWVYHKDTGATKRLYLNQTYAALANSTAWNDTAPTDSVFTVGTSSQTNGSGDGMIAYLFASLDGVSKVGSYTGNGSSDGDSQNIDCGFSSGARFVLIKRTDVANHWFVYDTERGIVAGNEGFLLLNGTQAENTTYDNIDPYSSGFTINQSANNLNLSGASYIYYAIA